MKKFMLMLALPLLFAACDGSADDEMGFSIVGKWEYTGQYTVRVDYSEAFDRSFKAGALGNGLGFKEYIAQMLIRDENYLDGVTEMEFRADKTASFAGREVTYSQPGNANLNIYGTPGVLERMVGVNTWDPKATKLELHFNDFANKVWADIDAYQMAVDFGTVDGTRLEDLPSVLMHHAIIFFKRK